MNKSVKIFFKILLYIMLFTGFAGFVGGGLIAGRIIDVKRELPLSHVTSVLTDEDGNIYLGLAFYGKIQKYSARGEFIKNWIVETANGGAFNVEINDGAIYAITAKGGEVEQFDLNGNKKIIKEYNTDYDWRKTNTSLKISNEKEYKFEGYFNYKLVVEYSSGEKETIIAMNLFNRILRGPIPAWLIFMTGLLGLLFLEKWGGLKN